MKSDIKNIAYLCKNNPVGRKILIVPTLNMSGQILRVLNDNGVSVVNLEIKTVDMLAYSMVESDIIKQQLSILDTNSEIDLVRDVIFDLKSKGLLCYFDNISNTYGFNRLIAATLKCEVAKALAISENVKVCAGAGDNAAAAIGTGTVSDGACNISLGTSGTVFISSDDFSADKDNALHSFCHANGKYHVMGCILSAASCNAWWSDCILDTTDYNGEQRGLKDLCGKNEVFFLPYLMGERSPHNDVNARGAFIGISPDTSRKKMTLAVLEGVAFALRDCVEIAKKNGINIKSSKICGGGAKSKLCRQIIADVLGIPIEQPIVEEGPSYGAAIFAMVGSGEYTNIDEAVKKLAGVKSVTNPRPEICRLYEKKYQVFRSLYPALKKVYQNMNELN